MMSYELVGGLRGGRAPGTKNNFGFNVKYNKSNTNLQGNINTIVREHAGGHRPIRTARRPACASIRSRATR
jgi:hypothetical protein